ncbi:MAG: DUF5320 domain-containing protein [Candidatus Omnitrophica bacterium]|nr:DUF5320 domain-containing protein [Candidatus Omnitrophota bacterium]
MPGGDGTGPAGMGPMTGRAAGYCAGYPAPGYMNPISGAGWGGFGYGGRGRGRGFSWGRGWGRGAYPYGAAYYGVPNAGGYYGALYGSPYNPQITSKQEADILKDQAKAMQEDIDSINERIKELESTAKSEKKK